MPKGQAKSNSDKKPIIIVGIIGLFLIVGYFLFPKGGTYSINQPIQSNEYIFSSSLTNGEMTLTAGDGNSIVGTSVYKGPAPVGEYIATPPTYILKSSNSQSEARNINLPKYILTKLEVEVGNGNFTLDGRDLNLSEIKISLGNGNMIVTIPRSGSLKANLDLGNGNVFVKLPVKNELDGIKFVFPQGKVPEMDLGKTFEKTAEGYQSVGYKEGKKNAEISVSIVNGNVNITSID